ncbi:helix-turn-helix domain-containing protein [Sphaerimonospora cavernae]|uniref:Helix-turn-helix domain-containing protein n=1 Tax=Sphaerimonospora cavernae TaxID=1740611 RepID=A0ABV6U7Y2_9ACTN
MDDAFAHDMIGRRIAHARKLRDLTQRELAERVPCSKSLIAQVEGGHKPATPSLISAVARVLHVDVTELTGQPYRGATAATDRIHEAIPQIRQALAHWDIPPDPDVAPRPLPELAAVVDHTNRLRETTRYTELGGALPALITELSAHAHTATAPDRGHVFGLLSTAYTGAYSLACKLGYTDLMSIAVERAIWAAWQSDDPLLPAVAEYKRTMAFMVSGAYAGGMHLLHRALRRLEPLSDDRALLSVYGSLHLRQAILAARDNRPTTAWDHIGAAQEIAVRTGDTPDYGLSFGPSNTAIHSVAVAVELGDADEAIRRNADLVLPPSMTPERTSHHYIDLSRAWLWQGRWDKALGCVLTAERIAPQMTRYHPMSRETVARLLDLQRRLPSPLRGLARRMGITT